MRNGVCEKIVKPHVETYYLRNKSRTVCTYDCSLYNKRINKVSYAINRL